MPEKLADKTIFSLAEVAHSIQKTIADRYRSVYWVKAEMNKLNHYTHSGHCYPELVEKKEGKVIAEMRSVLWKMDFLRINQRFIELAKEPLRNGITILFQASISYDPLYGLSLRILDIDPTYSLGELEREKLESINRLKQEGLFDANKRLPFPLLPKRLAIISVETSKGYADFLKIIDRNAWGYHFEHTLFAALLQGDKSISSIISQLRRIAGQTDRFDVAAIIRGGGGDVGLSSYNNYLLASAIARFPIPVLTGIGHSTNETVSEMVAYQNAITPSELADFLIQRFHNFAVPVQRAQDSIAQKTLQLLAQKGQTLDNFTRYFSMGSLNLLERQRRTIVTMTTQFHTAAGVHFSQKRHELKYSILHLKAHSHSMLQGNRIELSGMDNAVRLLDPQQVLSRGYSITKHKGKAIKNTAGIEKGASIETVLASGKITSTVTNLTPTDHE